MSYETKSSFFMVFFLQQNLFYNRRWKYSSFCVEKIPQGKPYKLACKIVESKENINKKGVKHLRDRLKKLMWLKDVTFWFVTKCLKKFLHCRSNLQRNKNVVLPVTTKFRLVSKCYKIF